MLGKRTFINQQIRSGKPNMFASNLQSFIVLLIMTSFINLIETVETATAAINLQSENTWNKLTDDIELVQIPEIEQTGYDQNKQKNSEQNFQGLDQLDLLESRTVQNNNSQKKQNQHEKKKRIKQIEEEKKKIIDEMKHLQDEIEEIRGSTDNQNNFKKRYKIQRDQNAAKNAEKLVNDLKMQRKQIEAKKRKDQEKRLLSLQKEEDERRKVREEEALKMKEEKRLAILKRMEEEKKRKQERKQIEEQSNQLIVKLKKQEKLQKETTLAPSQIIQVQNKKRALLQKKNKLDIVEIEQHDRRYRAMKMQAQKQKEQRAQSLKVQKSSYLHKYGKNIWMEKLEEQELRKKQEQKFNEEKKKNQLQKRLKYGQLVKNIFLPKRKEKSTQKFDHFEQNNATEQQQQSRNRKPKTPQNIPSLPKIKSHSKRNTQNSKMYKEESLPGIRNSKKLNLQSKEIKQFDADDEEREKIRKLREMQLRKQTNQRLKKLQNANTSKVVPSEKKKYENYLGKVKIKKENGNEWKKIMDNNTLTEQEKYKQLMKRANQLQSKAKLKQDKNIQRQANQDAVNLYIGSIQAKLALLQKF